jgi:mono/diheme cytochrome c family protein
MMFDEQQKHPENRVHRAVAAFFVVAVMVLSGCSKDPVLVQGEDIFRKYCSTCHQPDGQGLPGLFPSLHESDWVAGDKGRLIRLALRGMQGPIVVNGNRFSNVMTPHDFLTDEQISAVLTFVRQSFGNDAEAVLADEVARVRISLTDDAIFDASVLEGISGIPDSTATGEIIDSGL